MEITQDAVYPILAHKTSRWTNEFRKQWNKDYRAKIKSGEHTPNRRVEESKWENPEFRRSYDVSRNTKIAEEKRQIKVSFDPSPNGKRPNYTKQEKEEILKRWIELIRQGENPDHPYMVLSLDYKPQFKREYRFKDLN